MKTRTVFTRALAWRALVYLLVTPFFSCIADTPPSAVARQWGWEIPQKLSDSNTRVTFEVDSTWHLVKGVTSGVEGSVWLADSSDPLSIRATLKFPVGKFMTGRDSRDERMREVMNSNQFPDVTLALEAFEPLCAPENCTPSTPCAVTLRARLSIRGSEKLVILAGILTREPEHVTISGDTRFSWADYGVEDPSILVAKLDPEVVVSFSVRLPAVNDKEG